MTIGAIVVIIATLLVIAVLAVAGSAEYARRRTRASFGPEYEGIARRHGSRRAADREITRRREVQAALVLRPLTDEDRAYYQEDWRHVQGAFLDDPAVAVGSADALVLSLVRSMGYPDADDEELFALLSVAHGNTITGYREARRVGQLVGTDPRNVSTETMRQALEGYGAFLEDVVSTAVPASAGQPVRGSGSQSILGSEAQR
jgi:hypothetical protein